jgi:TolB protein
MKLPSIPFGCVIGLFALVGVLAAFGVALFAALRTDGPATAGNRIVIVDVDGGIRTVAPDGGSVRQYDIHNAGTTFPAFSPDGGRLAAIGLAGQAPGVYMLDEASREGDGPAAPARVFDGAAAPPFYLDWTPDGRSVAFLASEADGLSMRVVPADGSAEAMTVHRGSPLYWDWADPTHALIHAGTTGPDAYFGEVSTAGGTAEASVAVMPAFRAPGISHDGRYRAYVVDTDQPGSPADVSLVIDERGGEADRRIPLSGPTAFGWSPSASELAYLGSSGSTLLAGSLLLASATETAGARLVDGDVIAFVWAPDGRSIAAFSLTPQDTAPNAGEGVRLRLTVVDVATRAVRLERLVAPAAPILEQFVPFFDQYALSHRLWSPASDALVLPLVDDEDVSKITILSIDRSPDREVGPGVIAFWSPS